MKIKSIYQSMNRFEKAWLLIFSFIILVTTIYFSSTSTKWESFWSIALNWVISPVSALTGVVCVVLCAKGHIDNWIWGLINSITYGALALASGYYGDWMLNWFFFIPTQIIIFLAWKNNIPQKDSGIVKMKRLNWKQTVIYSCLAIGIIWGLSVVLSSVNNWFIDAFKRNSTVYGNIESMFGWKYFGPVLDSVTVMFQIFAEIFLIKRIAEQWPLWFATNIASILIWATVIITDKTSYGYAIPTLIMWVAYLVNSLYGNIVWFKKTKLSRFGDGIPLGRIVSLSGDAKDR